MADLLDKDFKTAVLKLIKEVKKVKKMMYAQNGNVDKEIENLKRNQKGILELKITITEIKIHYRNLETDLST